MKTNNWILLALLGAIACLAMTIFRLGPSKLAAKTLEFEENQIQLGTVPEGQHGFTLTLKNNSSQFLELTDLQASCSCLELNAPELRSIPPLSSIRVLGRITALPGKSLGVSIVARAINNSSEELSAGAIVSLVCQPTGGVQPTYGPVQGLPEGVQLPRVSEDQAIPVIPIK
jgi:hypothetical protein